MPKPRSRDWFAEQTLQMIGQNINQFFKPYCIFLAVASPHDDCEQEPCGESIAHEVDVLPTEARAVANDRLNRDHHDSSFFLGRTFIGMNENWYGLFSATKWLSINRMVWLQFPKSFPKI